MSELLACPYGSLSLTEASPRQSWVEPLTLGEVAAHSVLHGGIADEDQLLIEELYIPAAREFAEIMQGRDLVVKQYDLSLDYWPGQMIKLREPLISVDLVQYRDSDGNQHVLTENVDYSVDLAKRSGLLLPAYGKNWPSFTSWPSSAVLVRFTSGMSPSSSFWTGAGRRVKLGMVLLIAHWIENRLPFVTAGVGAIEEYPYAVTQCLSFGAIPQVG